MDIILDILVLIIFRDIIHNPSGAQLLDIFILSEFFAFGGSRMCFLFLTNRSSWVCM